MSFKIHFLDSYQDIFSSQSLVHGVTTVGRASTKTLASYCWKVARDVPDVELDVEYPRKRKKKDFYVILQSPTKLTK